MRRPQLDELCQRHPPALVMAAFGLVNGALSIGLLGALAHWAHSPFLFPSLGPTAFLLFYRPRASSASPRNALFGHFIGAVMGWLALFVFGLTDEPSALVAGITWAHVGAAALSLGGTSGLMALFNVPHPPAGATTLIISMGLMPFLWQIPVLMAAVVLLLVQAFIINRLAGVRYPWWAPGNA